MSSRPIYLMAGSPAADPQKAAQKASQKLWLKHAFDGGPLPTHSYHIRGDQFDPRDRDPSAVDLDRFQRELARANAQGELLTFSRTRSCWEPLDYPSTSTPSTTTRLQPSGFRNLRAEALPLCPHAGNPLRRDEECRMRPHSHRHKRLGTVYYLQATLHPCSFIVSAVLQDAKVKTEVKSEPLYLSALTPHPAVKREFDFNGGIAPVKREFDFNGGIAPVKREIKRETVELKQELLGGRFRAMTSTRRGTSSRKPSGLPLRRQNALLFIPESSSPSSSPTPASASSSSTQPPVFIDLDDDNDDEPPAYTPPQTHPQCPVLPRPLVPGSPHHLLRLERYTPEEAHLNLTGDAQFLQQTEANVGHILATQDFSSSFWMRETAPDFPQRLCPFRNGSTMAIRIGCGSHFTPAALNSHLVKEGDVYVCGNHPNRAPSSPVEENIPYHDLLRPRDFPPARGPGQLRPARFTEFGYTTALGIALSSLNTRLGLPDDVWQAVRSAMVPCMDCACIRTVHGHLDHLDNGVCRDVSGDFLIAVSAEELKAYGPRGEIRRIVVEDD
ncbi:hypothetical protein B0H19DRAFT_1068147 [Mycena capillaripes]|nr:hypothetical protein B0H19DRAFT_1068147 [Mycena capillaripes]